MDSWTEQACDTSGRHTQSDHILSAHPLACKLVQSSDQIQSRTAIHWSLCGVLVFDCFWFCIPSAPPPPSASVTLSHTHNLSHNFVTRNL